MILTGTKEDLESLVVDEFVFGAPFRCTYFGNSVWDEESQAVFGCKNGEVVSSGATTRLQEVGYSEALGSHFVYHIDAFPFSTKTLGDYYMENPDDEAIRSRVCDESLEETTDEEGNIVMETVYTVKEGFDVMTPQDYVKENIYTKYNLTEVQIG